eukprot:GHVH01017162.1.p1 GENE.GHVH01017162.1~~GHVH01017162.1.p1  ORF type:complete len:142 (+),score=17.66 GHVH01017162.1:75-500(+)
MRSVNNSGKLCIEGMLLCPASVEHSLSNMRKLVVNRAVIQQAETMRDIHIRTEILREFVYPSMKDVACKKTDVKFCFLSELSQEIDGDFNDILNRAVYRLEFFDNALPKTDLSTTSTNMVDKDSTTIANQTNQCIIVERKL